MKSIKSTKARLSNHFEEINDMRETFIPDIKIGLEKKTCQILTRDVCEKHLKKVQYVKL